MATILTFPEYANPQGKTAMSNDDVEEVFDVKQAFVNFIGRILCAIESKQLTHDEVQEVCAKHGIASLSLLGHHLDLVRQIAMDVECIIVHRW